MKAPQKRERPNKKDGKKIEKNERKERRDNVTILLPLILRRTAWDPLPEIRGFWHRHPDFMKNKRGQISPNKKGRPKKPIQKWENKKMREKERRGNVTILLPHLCFKIAPCSSYRESLELSLSYTSGNFHYRTWLVYSNDGLPQMP